VIKYFALLIFSAPDSLITGTVFVFRLRRANRLKLSYWDGTGLVLAYKRLKKSTFTGPAIKDDAVLGRY